MNRRMRGISAAALVLAGLFAPPTGAVINQVDGRKPVIEREMAEALRETYGDLVLKATINKRVKVEESPAFQKAITLYDPKGPAVDEFNAMVSEIMGRIKN